MNLTFHRRAFPRGTLPAPDSDDDVSAIRAQHAKKLKKGLTNFEHHCAAGREFTSPSPPPERPATPDMPTPSMSTNLLSKTTTASTSVTTVWSAHTGTATDDSDLSPAPPSDDELGGSLLPKGTNSVPPPIASTSTATVSDATPLVACSTRKLPSGDLGTGSVKPKKGAAKKCGRKNSF